MRDLQGSFFDRFYFLSFSTHCSKSCSYCPAIGCRNSSEKGLDGIEKSIAKAKSAEYSRMVLPCNWPDHADAEKYIDLIDRADMQLVLQVHWRDIEKIPAWRKIHSNAAFNILLDAESSGRVWSESQENYECYYTLVATRGLDLAEFVLQVPDFVRDQLYLYFPFHLKPSDRFLDSIEVAEQLELLQLRAPTFKIRPQRGHEVFEPRLSVDNELEVLVEAENFSASRELDEKVEAKIEISVIIPCYNNAVYLANTVRHLLQQNLHNIGTHERKLSDKS